MPAFLLAHLISTDKTPVFHSLIHKCVHQLRANCDIVSSRSDICLKTYYRLALGLFNVIIV